MVYIESITLDLNTLIFLKQKNLFAKHTIALEIPESEVQDIDNEEDWKMAEMKYKMLKMKNRT